jgi:hypothetical protein
MGETAIVGLQPPFTIARQPSTTEKWWAEKGSRSLGCVVLRLKHPLVLCVYVILCIHRNLAPTDYKCCTFHAHVIHSCFV